MAMYQFMYGVLPPRSRCTGLASGLVGQVAAALELKIEKQDKDEMNDNLSTDDKSDDESDKRDMKTPRGGTRTRWEHEDTQSQRHIIILGLIDCVVDCVVLGFSN